MGSGAVHLDGSKAVLVVAAGRWLDSVAFVNWLGFCKYMNNLFDLIWRNLGQNLHTHCLPVSRQIPMLISNLDSVTGQKISQRLTL